MSRDSPSRIYVGKLDRDVRERDLEDLFRKYGHIRNIDMKNGFAFVHYEDPRDAEDAIHYLDNERFMGSNIVVQAPAAVVVAVTTAGIATEAATILASTAANLVIGPETATPETGAIAATTVGTVVTSLATADKPATVVAAAAAAAAAAVVVGVLPLVLVLAPGVNAAPSALVPAPAAVPAPTRGAAVPRALPTRSPVLALALALVASLPPNLDQVQEQV
eukprot:CAMPEP_0175100704 /NCGR_PEP_ID=MMETSP0086_2-20121207/7289_1 /TAXON_ID=136419 /ORGANISM="Unknown Unknown, Strain D1" /LENGTH=219 /DNA_ID=CAMNT_0016374953 /DNA_START=32 /DNA_END=693 /DNA_ORIENTATION=+